MSAVVSLPPPALDRAALLQQYERAIRALARRFTSSGVDVADLVQIGRLAFWEALGDWRPTSCASPWPYCRAFVFGAMMRAVQRERRHRVDELDDARVVDPDQPDEDALVLGLVLDSLDEYDRALVRLRVVEGVPAADVAVQLGVHRNTINGHVDRVLERMRKRLR